MSRYSTIFSIVCAFEILLLILISSIAEANMGGICCYKISLNDLFLRLQTIIILPSELIYSIRSNPPFNITFAKDLGVDWSERLLAACCTVWWCLCPCTVRVARNCHFL